MKNKILSLLLCITLVLSLLPTLPVLAAETVVFADDFSAYNAGETPKTASNTQGVWSYVVQKETVKVSVVEEGKNKMLRLSNDGDDTLRSPRIEKYLNLNPVEEITFRFRVRVEGSGAKFALQWMTDATANTQLFFTGPTEWKTVEVTINKKNLTAKVTADGAVVEEKRGINPVTDWATCQFRFLATVKDGTEVLLDDVEISVDGSADVALINAGGKEAGKQLTDNTGITDSALELSTTPPQDIKIPAKANVLMNDTFNYKNDKIDTTKGYWSSHTAYIAIKGIGENKVLEFNNNTTTARAPRIEKSIYAEGMKKAYVEFAFIPAGGKVQISLQSDGKANTNLIIAEGGKKLGTQEISQTDWNYAKIELDFEKSTVTSSVNGAAYRTDYALGAIADLSTTELWFMNLLPAGQNAYFDNVVVYTYDKVESNRVLLGDKQVDWANVAPKSMQMSQNLKPHPRIFVTEWDSIKAKIQTDANCQKWYEGVKMTADKYLTMPVTEFIAGATGSALPVSQSILDICSNLAFVYNIEGDERYKQRCIEEIIHAGTFPSWDEEHYLTTAQFMAGVSMAYDWLYNFMTEAERAQVLDVLMRMGINTAVYVYHGINFGVDFTKMDNNWNVICNTNIMLAAIAIADEYPHVCDYLLEKAGDNIPLGLTVYKNGGYAEGIRYWSYGTGFLLRGMAVIDSAAKDADKIPQSLRLWDYPGVAETCDFPVYYNGPAEAFIVGDGTSRRTRDPWFFWAADYFDKPQYAWYELNAEKELGYNSGLYALLSIIWYDKDKTDLAPGSFSLDKFYDAAPENIPLLTTNSIILRSSWEDKNAIYAAMHGGSNDTSHIHLALGSFVIEADGVRWFTHPDVNTYAVDNYFGNGRFDYYWARAEGHNTIIANPNGSDDQKQSAFAQVIASGTSATESFGIMDITQTNDVFADAKRGIRLTNNRSRVIVQDEIKTKSPAELYWFAHTEADITISADKRSVLLEQQGKRLWINIMDGPTDAKFYYTDTVPLSVSPAPEGNSKNPVPGHRLTLHMENVSEMTLAIEFVPLKDGETAPTSGTAMPLASWSADTAKPTPLVQKLGDVVALKLNTPRSFGKGQFTFVDTNNTAVVPFTENSRTLVPVRFIAESFGAKVGWEDATQTVTVNYEGKTITLRIGEAVMYVDGAPITLDTAANTYNDRTFVPLRAIAEAIGKQVFWDDRGLIVISQNGTSYDAETTNALINALDILLTVDGKPLPGFDLEKMTYYVEKTNAPQTVGLFTNANSAQTSINIIDASQTQVTINGKLYTVHFKENPFAGIAGMSTAGYPREIELRPQSALTPPAVNPWIPVQYVDASDGFVTYLREGTVDNDLETRWSTSGEHWISYDFGSVQNVHSMAIACYNGHTRKSIFDILVSEDGSNWTTVKTKHETSGTTSLPEIIELGDVRARYVKLMCYGNSTSTWNSYSELRFYNDHAQEQTDASLWGVYFGLASAQGKPGTSLKLKLVAKDKSGAEFALPADATAHFESEDSTVATVDQDGTVHLHKSGTVRISVTVKHGDMTKVAHMDVLCE